MAPLASVGVMLATIGGWTDLASAGPSHTSLLSATTCTPPALRLQPKSNHWQGLWTPADSPVVRMFSAALTADTLSALGYDTTNVEQTLGDHGPQICRKLDADPLLVHDSGIVLSHVTRPYGYPNWPKWNIPHAEDGVILACMAVCNECAVPGASEIHYVAEVPACDYQFGTVESMPASVTVTLPAPSGPCPINIEGTYTLPFTQRGPATVCPGGHFGDDTCSLVVLSKKELVLHCRGHDSAGYLVYPVYSLTGNGGAIWHHQNCQYPTIEVMPD